MLWALGSSGVSVQGCIERRKRIARAPNIIEKQSQVVVNARIVRRQRPSTLENRLGFGEVAVLKQRIALCAETRGLNRIQFSQLTHQANEESANDGMQRSETCTTGAIRETDNIICAQTA